MSMAIDLFICISLLLLSAYYLALVKKIGYSNEISGFLAGVYLSLILITLLIHVDSAIFEYILPLGLLISGCALSYASKFFLLERYTTVLLGSSSVTFWFLSWSHPCLFKSLFGRIAFFVFVFILFLVAIRNCPVSFPYICHSLIGSYLFILGVDSITDVGIMDIFLAMIFSKRKIDFSAQTYVPLLLYIFLFLFGFYVYCIRQHPKPLSSMIQV